MIVKLTALSSFFLFFPLPLSEVMHLLLASFLDISAPLYKRSVPSDFLIIGSYRHPLTAIPLPISPLVLKKWLALGILMRVT